MDYQSQAPTRRPIVCYGCNETGHIRANFPKEGRGPRPSRSGQQGHLGQGSASANGTRLFDSGGRKAYLQMKICNQACSGLLDTDCEQTVLPARLVDKEFIKPTTQRLLAANGSVIPVLGTVSVMAQVENAQFPIEGLVSEHVFEPMIGI